MSIHPADAERGERRKAINKAAYNALKTALTVAAKGCRIGA